MLSCSRRRHSLDEDISEELCSKRTFGVSDISEELVRAVFENTRNDFFGTVWTRDCHTFGAMGLHFHVVDDIPTLGTSCGA